MSQKDNTPNPNKALALLCIIFLLFTYKETVWDVYFSQDAETIEKAPNVTTPQELEAEKADASVNNPKSFVTQPTATTIAKPQAQPAAPAVEQTTPSSREVGYPSDKELKRAGVVVFSTNDVEITFTKLGGRLLHHKLLDYAESPEKGSPALDLVKHTEYAPFPLGAYTGNEDDAWVKYTLIQADGDEDAKSFNIKSDRTFVFEGSLADGRTIRKTLVIPASGYMFDVNVSLSAPGPRGESISLEWTKFLDDDSATLLDPYNISGFTWFDGEKADRKSVGDMESEVAELGAVRWVSLGTKYFVATVLSPDKPEFGYVLKTNALYRARLNGGEVNASFQIYAGPKSLDVLENAGFELKRNIDFGWAGFVSAPLLSLLFFFHDLLGNYGLAIVALTLLVKALLYPLTSASYKQMKAMQDLAPEMKRIKESKSDKQQQQMEIMALYKKKGVNPLGGCLPMLLQMPILFGLYSGIMVAVELRHAPFAFWIQDLSSPEALMIAGFGVPVMVVLLTASMLAQQWLTPSAMDPAQKKTMMIMPVVFGFMFAKFPAGLTLYYLTNIWISLGQQKAIQQGDAKKAVRITVLLSAGLFGLALLLVWLGN